MKGKRPQSSSSTLATPAVLCGPYPNQRLVDLRLKVQWFGRMGASVLRISYVQTREQAALAQWLANSGCEDAVPRTERHLNADDQPPRGLYCIEPHAPYSLTLHNRPPDAIEWPQALRQASEALGLSPAPMPDEVEIRFIDDRGHPTAQLEVLASPEERDEMRASLAARRDAFAASSALQRSFPGELERLDELCGRVDDAFNRAKGPSPIRYDLRVYNVHDDSRWDAWPLHGKGPRAYPRRVVPVGAERGEDEAAFYFTTLAVRRLDDELANELGLPVTYSVDPPVRPGTTGGNYM